MPIQFLQRMAADLTQRLFLILAAAIVLAAVLVLVCAALVVGLANLMPLWAACSVTAALLLILAVIFIGAALGRPAPPQAERQRPESAALGIGQAVGEMARQRPKATFAAALALGVALGANPGLRRDLIDLLRRSGNSGSDRPAQ